MERMEQAQITTVGHVEQNWNKIQNQLYTTLVKFNLKPRDVILKLHSPVARRLVKLKQWNMFNNLARWR